MPPDPPPPSSLPAEDSPTIKEQQLVASPESQTPVPASASLAEHSEADWEDESEGNDESSFTIRHDDFSENMMRSAGMQLLRQNRQQANERDDLKPYVQTLGLRDLESVLALENAAFPEHERESRDTLIYRLTSCSELSLGIFSTASTPQDPTAIPTYPSATPPDSANSSKKAVLVAMVVATKTTTLVATDAAMQFPEDWKQTTPLAAKDDPRGHKEQGRTIALWSVAVLPAYQGKKLGMTIMKSYQQRMETSGIADRIVLLAHDPLVSMYEGMGFVSKGKSEVKFAGGGWNDMAYEFSEKDT